MASNLIQGIKHWHQQVFFCTAGIPFRVSEEMILQCLTACALIYFYFKILWRNIFELIHLVVIPTVFGTD